MRRRSKKASVCRAFRVFAALRGGSGTHPACSQEFFCPLGRDKERRQVRRLFAAEMAARRGRGVTMVYINRENHEFDDLNRNF